MGRWESFRDKITGFITANGSTVIITPRTPIIGNYGGYEPGSEGEGTAVSTVGISSKYLIGKTGHIFGKLKEGEVTITLKYSETVEKDYEITWQDDNYEINNIHEIRPGNVLVGIIVKLKRKLD